MYVKCLVDNESQNDLTKRHGLSLYIETAKHKLLFDVGPDDTFLKNAEKMGINIGLVDILVISHGHYDHGGGLNAFLNANDQAKVYVNKLAFGDYFSKNDDFSCYIGLDKSVDVTKRFVFVDGNLNIDDELYLFSHITDKLYQTKSYLYKYENNNYYIDDFLHEQNLIITVENINYLFTGCAHNGIVNILLTGEKIIKSEFDYVFGGFHLISPYKRGLLDDQDIKDIGKTLCQKDTMYYAMHCTGIKPYKLLKEVLFDKIDYFMVGNCLRK